MKSILKRLKQLELINDFLYVKSKNIFIVKFSKDRTWNIIEVDKENSNSLLLQKYKSFLRYDNGLEYLLANKIIKDVTIKDSKISFNLISVNGDTFKYECSLDNQESILLSDIQTICLIRNTVLSFLKGIINTINN